MSSEGTDFSLGEDHCPGCHWKAEWVGSRFVCLNTGCRVLEFCTEEDRRDYAESMEVNA